MTIRIMVADERRLVSEAIAETLKLVRDFEVVKIINDNNDVVTTVVAEPPSAIVLGAPASGRDELRLAVKLRAVAPACGVAIIVTEPTRTLTDLVLTAGAVSLVAITSGLTHLVHAIRGVVAGCPIIDPTLLRASTRKGIGTLSDRERDVLRLTVDGTPIREIASELFLSPGTVRNLTSSAIKRLDARNRFEAARIATKRGWL